VPQVAKAFGAINDVIGAIAAATKAGTSFVFGYLGGGPSPSTSKRRARNSFWRCRRCPW